MKRLLIYLVLVVAVAGVCFAWFAQGRKGTAPAVSLSRDLYLVAEAPLAAGKFIASGSVSWKALDGDELERLGIDAGELVRRSDKTREMLNGAVPRADIGAGQYIPENVLVKPSDTDFLPTVLRSGCRGVAIGVNDVTGGAGLFRPGNYVDVLITMKPRAKDRKDEVIAKTLLQNVRILAVNRDLGVARAEEKETKGNSARKRETVTLEVSPKAAEVLALASTMGEISLSLCSTGVDDPAGAPGETMTSMADIVSVRNAPSGARTITTYYGASKQSSTAN